MNPKDEVKFEDIKKLVNASLEKFYKNDRDLIEMSNEEDMISEQCMVFHIGSYMKNKMNTLTKFQWADLTDQKEDFKYNFGLFVELGSHEVYMEVYQEGNLQTKLNYSITY